MSRFFATFFIIMIIIVWYAYERGKATRKAKQTSDNFWALEQKANSTRRKPIDDLSKITIPLEQLPFEEHPSQEAKECQDYLVNLSTVDIINLTGISNTDLKLSYGAPNFPYLSQCDENYTKLVRCLNQWARVLLSEDKTSQAQTVLEFAVSIHSDVSTTYDMLSKLYIEQKASDKILKLIDIAEQLETLLKPQIIKKLEEAYVLSGADSFESIL